MSDGALTAVEKEHVVLRVAWRTGCRYEWSHHHHMARQLGVSAPQIAALSCPTTSSAAPLSRRLMVLIEVADELVQTRGLSQESWDRAAEILSADELLELCFLVGHYVMVAMTINATGIEPEQPFLDELSEIS